MTPDAFVGLESSLEGVRAVLPAYVSIQAPNTSHPRPSPPDTDMAVLRQTAGGRL